MKIYPFFVRPRLPKALEPLKELTRNCWYSWNWQVVHLFIRMDAALWEESYQNPVEMLSRIPQDRLEELANDDSFVANVNRVYQMYQDYRNRVKWFSKSYSEHKGLNIAYFSMEFGIAEGLPIYSGGLGVLSGDHLKASSDLGVPLVGIGMLYQEGYFRQYLNSDGWQQESYPENDWYNMPVEIRRDDKGEPVTISVKMNGEVVHAQIWCVNVGMTPLFLLDTNIDKNPPHLRNITQRLYGGDKERRIQQEILLGIGGARALTTLGYEPHVYHINEGHSAFLILERLRDLTQKKGLSLKDAYEVIWATSVFTTHTPVPAGNEHFSNDLMEKYLRLITNEMGMNYDQFMSMGRINPENKGETFCMTVLALKMSAFCNGVSKIHGSVSRKMWKSIWADLPLNEVPIRSITNGIHSLTWLSHDLRELLTTYMGPAFAENPWDLQIWKQIERIPDVELWRMHQIRRERLVFFARKRLRQQLSRRGVRGAALEKAESILNSQALTIGFARRFATYKRGDLLFTDPDRLHRILSNPKRPVQIIFSGKAHPQDSPGKEVIKNIVHYASEERFRPYIVFLEDYDFNVARYMLQGCDVWMNTPRRPLEASGTSGMKASANGILNLSVMDGWWDEAYVENQQDTGWSIGRGEEYDDPSYQDFVESHDLYDVLEREVVELFYERDTQNLPREWVRWMKSAISKLAPEFNSHRMLMQYMDETYIPAANKYNVLSENSFQKAKELAGWREKVRAEWGNVKVESVEVLDESDRIKSGEALQLLIRVRLGQLSPENARVQIYHGAMNRNDEIVDGQASDAEYQESQDGLHIYRVTLPAYKSGRRGYAARVVMAHENLVHPFMTNRVTWER